MFILGGEKERLNSGAMFIWVVKLDGLSEAFVWFLTKMVTWTDVSNTEPRVAATLSWIQVIHEFGLKTVFDTLTHI